MTMRRRLNPEQRKGARPLRKVQRLHAFTGKQLAVARPRRGDTIRTFVERERLTAGLPTVVGLRVDGEVRSVLRRDWDRRIRTRDHLVLLAAPRGGGGGGAGGGGSGQVASIVGLVALLAIAGPLGGGAALAGIIGHGMSTALASALIVGGGLMLISHFLGAGRPKPDVQPPVFSLGIGSNQARSQQPIPARYGRLKFYPDLASPIYFDYSGTKQTFHAIYALGSGEIDCDESRDLGR